MAAVRDQTVRVARAESGKVDGDSARDAGVALAETLRAHVADEAKRRPAETPEPQVEQPAVEKPAASPTAPVAPSAQIGQAAPKRGKRKIVLMGFLTLLALAATSYGVYYLLVGRFYISTDDAYVRANNTMLGARVSGHIAAILPADNSLVHAGDVVTRIDDGDYRIAVDAARTKIATQEATIARIGRQVTAQESAVEQAQANLASA